MGIHYKLANDSFHMITKLKVVKNYAFTSEMKVDKHSVGY